MENLSVRIVEILSAGGSVFIVGKRQSGKTYFTKHELLPECEKRNIATVYFEDCNHLASQDIPAGAIVAIDEIETFVDREMLERLHPEERPYYLPSYIARVAHWHQKLLEINNPCVYILTRNDDAVIRYLTEHGITADWNGKNYPCLEFTRQG